MAYVYTSTLDVNKVPIIVKTRQYIIFTVNVPMSAGNVLCYAICPQTVIMDIKTVPMSYTPIDMKTLEFNGKGMSEDCLKTYYFFTFTDILTLFFALKTKTVTISVLNFFFFSEYV